MNKILSRITPWDSEVFNLSCCELLTIDMRSISLDSDIDEIVDKHDFIYGRVSVGNTKVRTFLSRKGFISSEVSALAKLTSLNKRVITSKLPPTFSMKSKYDENIKSQLIKSANTMYAFSRFHESPFIADEVANKRMMSWVTDLVESDTACLMLVSNNNGSEKLIGYMFVTYEKEKANLLLGGVVKGAELYALTLWQQILVILKDAGINTVTARVSLSNLGVIKLYQYYEFQLTDFLVDYQLVRN